MKIIDNTTYNKYPNAASIIKTQMCTCPTCKSHHITEIRTSIHFRAMDGLSLLKKLLNILILKDDWTITTFTSMCRCRDCGTVWKTDEYIII